MNNYEITKEGLIALKKELDQLKKERIEVIETIKTAKSFGDLSENAEYTTARERQTFVETRLNDVEDKIKRAIVVENTKSRNVVGLGSKIEIVQVNNSHNETKIIELVSSSESDPMNNKISQDSPLGQALINKMVNDEATVKTPQKETRYKIKKIIE